MRGLRVRQEACEQRPASGSAAQAADEAGVGCCAPGATVLRRGRAAAAAAVQVIAGSDKGTVGKIVKVNTKTGTVVVEGVNIKVGDGGWGWGYCSCGVAMQRCAVAGASGARKWPRCHLVELAVCWDLPLRLEQGRARHRCVASARPVTVSLASLEHRAPQRAAKVQTPRLTRARPSPAPPPHLCLPRPPRLARPRRPQTKHVKPTAQGEAGQIVKKEFPVHHSNVQLYSAEKQVSSRVGYK